MVFGPNYKANMGSVNMDGPTKPGVNKSVKVPAK
jgi:hypothetical protein